MSKFTHGHYFCSECKKLFEAEICSLEEQICPICDKSPTGRLFTAVSGEDEDGTTEGSKKVKVHLENKEAIERDLEAEALKEQGLIKHSRRREKGSRRIPIVITVWFVLVTLTVAIIKIFYTEEDPNIDLDAIALIQQREREAELKQARELVRAVVPDCEKVLTNFLKATSPARKAQFVYRGREKATKMTRYYTKNPTFFTTRSRLKVGRGELLKGMQHETIGTICVNEQGETFEAIFIRPETEWLIDWDAMVRYSEKSWSLFPSGNDGDEGEFRLYMRVRASNENINVDKINLVFYQPEIYLKGKFYGELRGEASSNVSVDVDSVVGQKILKLVEKQKEQEQGGKGSVTRKDSYGFGIGILDPPGYHRVRVRMKLNKDKNEHSFELLEILTDYWYGDDVVASDEKN